MVGAHLTGAFPRSEQLVETTRAFERGRVSQVDLNTALYRGIAALVELQTNAGLDFIVDGQLNWQDLFRPFSEVFTGIQLGSLTRWFDNNSFYRKPIIAEKVGSRTTNIQTYFQYNHLPASAKKAILPGPFTFAVMSQNSAYSSLADLVDALAHALRDIATELCERGYSYLQFNEPCICLDKTTKPELEIAKHAFEICARGVSAKTALQTYFGDAAAVIDDLLDYPVDCIGLDMYAGSIDTILEYDFDKELGCGCIDGRNSLLESPDDLTELIAKVKQKIEPKRLFISPNCDLDFLPYSVAEKKIHLLSETKKKVA